MKNVVIVTHKFVTHPDDELVVYLNRNRYKNVLHISHPFYEVSHRRSYYVWYRKGKIYRKKQSFDFKNFPEPIIYLKELVLTLQWIGVSNLVWDLYIGMDGLCTLSGNILRALKKVKKTAYWAIDFVPKNRFAQGWKNKIYQWVNIHGYKNSDEMWDLSPRMAEARKKFLGIKENQYKKLRVVPYGMWTEKIKKYSYENCEQNTLVFMGRLMENQGAQLILQAIPKIVKKNSRFTLKIIGAGPYGDELKQLTKNLGVEKYCDFKGKILDHRVVEKEIAKSCIGIAPYIKKLDTWTYYADPGKVKTYLGCGVPVLLTDIPWNAREIEKNKCGIIIKEDINDIAEKVLQLMGADNNNYRKNAVKYSKSFDYNEIFKKLDL